MPSTREPMTTDAPSARVPKAAKRAPVITKPRLGRPRKEPRADDLAVLRALRDAAPGPKSATVISSRMLAARVGFSTAKLKTVVRSMLERGLIERTARLGADGACLANAYRITRKGRRLLAFDDGGASTQP